MLSRMVVGVMGMLAAAPVVAGEPGGNAYAYEFTSIDGGALPLSQFEGKVVMIVNTASMCGFTPQYDGLQAVWDKYRDQGLVVLGVPSGDFGNQEYGSTEQIKEFCEVNFAINFPMTTKQHVRGPDAHPFYKWAAAELGTNAAPRWNFHKYLVNTNGALVAWFPTTVTPGSPDVTRAIEAELKQVTEPVS